MINSDSQINPEVNGGNVFSYCGNSPVIKTDYNGKIGLSGVLGGVFTGASAAATAAIGFVVAIVAMSAVVVHHKKKIEEKLAPVHTVYTLKDSSGKVQYVGRT